MHDCIVPSLCIYSVRAAGPSEDDAFALLHPGVGPHQLRVQERVVANAALDPLHQLSDGDGGLLSVDGQLVLKALHFSPHLRHVQLLHDA